MIHSVDREKNKCYPDVNTLLHLELHTDHRKKSSYEPTSINFFIQTYIFMMIHRNSLTILSAFAWIGAFQCQSFTVVGKTWRGQKEAKEFRTTYQTSERNLFFADDSDEKVVTPVEEPPTVSEAASDLVDTIPSADVDLVMSDDDGFLTMAGSFLVDAFWLNSEHHQLGENVEISDDARTNLLIEQASDLQEKYGSRMGKRLLDAAVIAALDQETKKFLGLVTMKVTLLDKDEVLDSESAENIARNAVASLGPKQRRQYKDAPVDKIASELLDDTKAICVLSNLAVSVNARRRGIAKTLCEEAELLATDWGFDEMYLLVETANTNARNLYETKLGYNLAFTKEAATALRVNLESGEFIETEADTLILSKKI